MDDDERDELEDAELRERFRFLRERVFARSSAFVHRALDAVKQRLAEPEESFVVPFFIELANLVASSLRREDDRALHGADDDED